MSRASRASVLSRVFNLILLLVRNLAIAGLAIAIGLFFGRVLRDGLSTWPITVVGISAYVLFIIASPLAGMLFWIVTAPFSRFIYLDIIVGHGLPDFTLTRICAGVLVVIVLAQLATGKLKLPRATILDIAVVATIIGIGASLPASLDGFRSALVAFVDSYAVPAIIYFLARVLIRERRQVEMVVTAFVALGVILTTVAVQEQLSGSVLFTYSERSWEYTKDLHKLAGLLGSPAFFAALIVMATAFTVYRFTRSNSANGRLLYGLLTAYMAIGVFFTYNRAGYIALAIVLLGAAYFWPAFRRLFKVAAITGVIVLAVSWGVLEHSAVITQRLEARGPVEYRMEIWGRAAQILARSPLFGLGYGNFGTVYLQYNPAWLYGVVLPAPHNSLLEVMFNSGIVGGLPYAAMFALIIIFTVRFFRRARDGIGGAGADIDGGALILAFGLALIPYLVEAMVIDMVNAYYVNMVLMLAVGALFGWQAQVQANPTK